MRTGRRAALAIVLVAVALLAACTPGDDLPPPAAAAAGAREGGTLVAGIGRPGSVDPLDAYEPNGLLIARTMCDTLVEIDPRDGSIEPGLASSWEVQDNGTQLSLRIREGARFSDGRKVTARDVAYSLSRAASPSFAGRSADLLSPIFGWPELRGEAESRDPRARKELLGVRALTSDTVRIDLRFPLADAIRLFAHPVTAPVSRQATESNPDLGASRPVCSGPYRLARPWTASDTTIALERVPGYTGRSAVRTNGGAGYAARIELVVAGGPEAGALPNRAQLIVPPPGETVAPPPGFERVAGPAPGIELIGLPAGTTSPYRDATVRRALSLALDRERLATSVGSGARVPARGFVPPALAGVHRRGACGERITAGPDGARAKAMLEQAPVELNTGTLRLFYNDEGRNKALAEEVAAQWRDNLGLQIQAAPVPFDEMLTAATSGAGLTGPFRISWSAPYPSADALLAPLFSGGATNQANLGRWNDPAWDRSLNREARKAGDEDDRRLQYQQLEDRLCETMPAIPLLWEQAILDVRTGAVASPGGTYLDPLTGLPDLRNLWLP